MLGPRLGRYDNGFDPLPLGNPVNAILGLFVLWWGWLAFNSGSTYGVNEDKWKYAARAAVSTVMASMGGGIVGLSFSLTNPHGIDILSQINGILGSLVAVTGGCFLFQAREAVFVGMVGGFITCFTMPIVDKFKIDDPVGAFATHGIINTYYNKLDEKLIIKFNKVHRAYGAFYRLDFLPIILVLLIQPVDEVDFLKVEDGICLVYKV